MIKLVALIPLFPLLGFIINGFFGKKISKGLSGTIASLAVLASFIVSLLIFFDLKEHHEITSQTVNLFSWINSDTLKIRKEYEYKLLATSRTSTLQKEVTEAKEAGYIVVGMVSRGEHMVVMEREVPAIP